MRYGYDRTLTSSRSITTSETDFWTTDAQHAMLWTVLGDLTDRIGEQTSEVSTQRGFCPLVQPIFGSRIHLIYLADRSIPILTASTGVSYPTFSATRGRSSGAG